MFSIDEVSGNISTVGAVDFSTSAEIRLVVLAVDQGQNAIPVSTTVTIRLAEVNRHHPAVLAQSLDDSDPQHFTLVENSPAGSFVAHVLVSDADFGAAGRTECSLRAEDDDNRFFQLIPLFSGGEGSSAEYKLVSAAAFDREQHSAYEISLACRDFGEPVHRTRYSLVAEIADVDDNAPVFEAESYRFTVTENNRRGLVIGRVSASDADRGPNARVTYSLAPADNDSSTWFRVDPTSGTISAVVSFDREFVDHFHFVVSASSASNVSSSSSSSQVRTSSVL